MLLFSTTEEIKEHHHCTISFDYEDVKKYVRTVGESDIAGKLIGDELYQELLDFLESEESSGAAMNDLLTRVRDVLAPLVFYYYLPFAQGKAAEGGVVIIENESHRQAPGWMVDQIRQEAYDSAMRSAEALLKFLEKNKANYASWVSSPQYTVYKESFINTVDDFEKFVRINTSRRIFLAIKPHITRVEEEKIKPVLGADLYNSIKAEIADDGIESAEFEPLMKYIQKAAAHMSIALATHDINLKIDENGITLYENVSTGGDYKRRKQPATEQLENFRKEHMYVGENTLKELGQYLKDNADTYPDYKNSDEYAANDGEPYRNEEDKKVGGFLY